MSNTNRDYLVICDVKNSKLTISRKMNFYITDKNTSNIFIKLVTQIPYNSNTNQYIDMESAENYGVTMRIVKPNNEVKTVTASKLEDGAMYQVDLQESCKDIVGTYKCELLISTTINSRQELNTSDEFTYEVKKSVISTVGEIIPSTDSLTSQLINQVNAVEVLLENKADKNEVFSMANMGQDIKLAMTGGSVAVVGVDSILEPNIVNNQVTPVKTSFLKTGKNMLIGERITGGFVNWQTGEITSDNGYLYYDYTPVTPNSRISLNYHSALAFYDNSYNFVAGINGSGSKSKNYTLVNGEIEGQSKHGTYTVPTNACYIRISSSVSKKDVQLELGEVSTPYQKPYYYIEGLVEMDNRNIFIKQDNECTILTEKAKYIFKRVTDTSINVDAWRLYKGFLLDNNGTEYNMWSGSDAEGAIQIVGEDDFVCGYHGDEKVETIDILIDGVPIDMSHSNNLITSFNNITIVSKSKVYHCNTSSKANTQAFRRTKVLKFDSNKVTISNRFECLENLNINRASLALFQCRKSQDRVAIINKFSNNNDLILYDVPTTSTGVMPEQSTNMTKATFYTNCGVINFEITKGYNHPKYMGYISNFNDQNRLKVYFDYIKGSTQVSVGDILQTEFELSIN